MDNVIKRQYKVVRVTGKDEISDIEKRLNRLGALGWRLVHVTPGLGVKWYILEREPQ